MSAYQRAEAQRAVNSFGTFNDGTHDNVVVGLIGKGKSAGTDLGKDNKTIYVDLNFGNPNRDPVITIAHEGSHVADMQDYISHIGTQSESAYDLTVWQTERRAYFVSSYMAQAMGKESYYPDAPDKGYQVWNKGWEENERLIKRLVGVSRFTASQSGTTASHPGVTFSQGYKR